MEGTSTTSKFDELRGRAEELLAKRGGKVTESSEVDVLTLIHEIEVHQVELEMQNEELRGARVEVEQSRKQYADLYELAPIGYVTTNKKGRIFRANFMATKMLLTSKNDLINRGFSHFIQPEDHEPYFMLIRGVADGKVKNYTAELRLLRNSVPFYAQIEVAPSWDGSGQFTGWRIAFMDISDRKHAEEELRSIPSKLIEAQENERKRLAGELHDSVGQTLAALKFRIEHVITTLENREVRQALQLLHEYIPILQRSIDETRAIYMGLKPMVLSDFGLLATLEWYRLELSKLYPTPHVELETAIDEEDIPGELKTTMFRVVQEALNNTFKHSKSEWVDVRLAENNGAIELEITDDGIGMDLDFIMESLTAKSLGLMGMKERIELTGGEFTIKSAPNKGTTVKAIWRNHQK